MRRPGRVQVEGLSKNKFFFELSNSLTRVLGLREHYCLRPTARTVVYPSHNMFLTTLPVSAHGVLFDPSVFSLEQSHHSTSEVPSTGFLQEC